MIHHVMICLMAAFVSQRLLVVHQAEDIFGLDHHFLPTSQNCHFDQTPETRFEWATSDPNEKIVKFCPNKVNNKHVLNLGFYQEVMYPYMPAQIMETLEWINPDPTAWFIGQFAKYVLRPQKWFLKDILTMKKNHPGTYRPEQ